MNRSECERGRWLCPNCGPVPYDAATFLMDCGVITCDDCNAEVRWLAPGSRELFKAQRDALWEAAKRTKYELEHMASVLTGMNEQQMADDCMAEVNSLRAAIALASKEDGT